MSKISKTVKFLLLVLVGVLLLTRVSNTVFISMVAEEVEETLISEYDLENNGLISFVSPYIEEYLENELEVKDRFLIKIIEINGLIKGEYVSIMGRIVNTQKPVLNLETFEQFFIENSIKSPVEYKYLLDEIYTNIPCDEKRSDYEVMKIQLALTYTDDILNTVIEENMDLICDHVSSYFRETSVEEVNKDMGRQVIKDDLLDDISDLLNTDQITHIYLPVFVIQE